jgi:Icc protein
VGVEITTVADDEAVIFRERERVHYDGLRPDTVHELDGVEVRTLPRRGELLCRFATVNDVHFGETVAGSIGPEDVFPTFSVEDGSEPYPDFMNRGAIAEMAAIEPAAVIVKGDLTSNGTVEEYERFRAAYEPVFGDRLTVVRGNHDSYHGATFAAIPMQRVDLPGVTIALLDTARDGQVGGSLSAEQIEWLDELGASADRPVLVMGHHHAWQPGLDGDGPGFFGIDPEDSRRLLEVFVRRPKLVGYAAGHTHRNIKRTNPMTGDVPFVEVACVKDFPGTWAEYRVFEGAILQVHHRIGTPEAIEWTEKTRHMFGGVYHLYAFGEVEDRCFAIDTA